jgi:hypothetical protein
VHRVDSKGKSVIRSKCFQQSETDSIRRANPNGTDQTDYAHTSSRAPAPALPQNAQKGGGLIYDLDVVCSVLKERRLELEMGMGVRVYGSGVRCVCRCV